MSNEIYARVLDALYTDAIALADALGLPISVPNVVFPPMTNPEYSEQVHLEIRNFWAGIAWQSWGSDARPIATFQVSVIDPNQAGEINPTMFAGQVMDHYVNGKHLWTAHMERLTFSAAPTLLTSVQYGQKSIYPVSIPYGFTKP